MAEQKYKYTIRIPIDTTKDDEKPLEYKDVHFESSEECMKFLNITKTTFYNILSGRLTMTHKSKQHLKDIKITKYNAPDVDIIDPKEFRKSLLEKSKSICT